MKKILSYTLLCAALAAGIFFTAADCRASENNEDISYDQVASEGEKTSAQEVGVEGMEPIAGKDVKDGVYDVEVEVSSSMFPVEEASLTVSGGKMSAVLTMGGDGYLKLFKGTAQEAAKSDISSYIDYVEDDQGRQTYTISVGALDTPISIAAFSRRKEKWYDRSILFRADSLPEGSVLVELPDYEALEKAAREKRIAALKAEAEENSGEPAESDSGDGTASPEGSGKAQASIIEMEDGEYAINVDLEGGSGRSAVSSPALLYVRDGLAYAEIQWSSSNYDYMLVDGEKFLPKSDEGYSTFEIPITVFDEPMPVVADTTAMSTPHEVDYTLTFHSDSVMSKDQTPQAAAKKVVYMVFLIILVCIIVSYINKRRRNIVK